MCLRRRSAAVVERRRGKKSDYRFRRARDETRRAQTSCRSSSGSPCSITTARSGAKSPSMCSRRSPWIGSKILAPQHPEWKEQQPFKAAMEGDYVAIANAHAQRRDYADQCHALGHDDRRVSRKSCKNGWRPRKIPVSTARTPTWFINRCWKCWRICAPMASKPTSCRPPASNSCGSFPNSCTACRRSK